MIGVLMLGFGGPEPGCCGRRAHCAVGRPVGQPPVRLRCDDGWSPTCEAECFAAAVLGGIGENGASLPRIRAVSEHYRSVAKGFSPYTALTRKQAVALENELARRGQARPVELGLRHWAPWPVDGLRRLRDRGCTQARPLVLAPHQAGARWQAYLDDATRDADGIGLDILPALPALTGNPGYLRAAAQRIRDAVTGWSPERFAAAPLLLVAHAIPLPAERATPYRLQVEADAAAIAALVGHPDHAVAFVSAPDRSPVPWSSPTLGEALAAAKAAGAAEVVSQAFGFLVDHVEVLYDLDVAGAEQAAALGLGWTRAIGVHDHPEFIAALADLAMG